jgi:poly(3-hydroxybutyrate) depolymerase
VSIADLAAAYGSGGRPSRGAAAGVASALVRPGILAVYVAAQVVVQSRTVTGAPARRMTGPCVDCLASLPPGTDAAPLLVLLHGDGETADSMFNAWEPAASKRGILVFAPSCPRSEGCSSQSWWRWNGEPSWMRHQVSALGELRSIDPGRMWIAGWSGGATYLGWRTQAFERDYAALVVHGGGVRPADPMCPTQRASVYFLGGDRNPLHDLTEQLHEYYATTCPHEDLSWTVLKGVDHAGERRALPTYREAILDWLSTRRRTPLAAAVSTAASAPPPVPSAAAPQRPSSPTAPSSSCRCATAGGLTTSAVVPALVAMVIGAALRLRQGTGRSTPLTR